MPQELSYRETIDEARTMQIRGLLRELPTACADFLRNISLQTQVFTRLAYAMDMLTFFTFLHNERLAFADKPVVAYDDTDFDRLSLRDVESYVEYLTLYFKDEKGDGNEEHVRRFVNHDLSIKRKLSSLRAFYDYLFRTQRISSNILQLVTLPRPKDKPILMLSEEEMARILSLADSGESLTESQKHFHQKTSRRDYALLSLFLGTGIRVSECVGLNLADVNLEEQAFIVTRKGGNQVMLYFPSEVGQALQRYLELRETIETLPGHEEAFFLSLQRRRITVRAVQQLVKKYASHAAPLKPRISPHKLRTTYATNLYNNTGDIYLVADALGHSSVDTTKRHYAQISAARRRLAAEATKLPHSAAELTDLHESSISHGVIQSTDRNPKGHEEQTDK